MNGYWKPEMFRDLLIESIGHCLKGAPLPAAWRLEHQVLIHEPVLNTLFTEFWNALSRGPLPLNLTGTLIDLQLLKDTDHYVMSLNTQFNGLGWRQLVAIDLDETPDLQPLREAPVWLLQAQDYPYTKSTRPEGRQAELSPWRPGVLLPKDPSAFQFEPSSAVLPIPHALIATYDRPPAPDLASFDLGPHEQALLVDVQAYEQNGTRQATNWVASYEAYQPPKALPASDGHFVASLSQACFFICFAYFGCRSNARGASASYRAGHLSRIGLARTGPGLRGVNA